MLFDSNRSRLLFYKRRERLPLNMVGAEVPSVAASLISLELANATEKMKKMFGHG